MKTGLLLSGGMDSSAIAYWLRPDVAFTVDYGQLSVKGEVYAANKICEALGIKHEVLKADCAALGSGAMFGIPALPLAPVPEWFPFRNQLLLTVVGIRALQLELETLLFGAVKSDARQADGSEEFFTAITALFTMQEGHLRVSTPALQMTTVELIREAQIPFSILGWAHSCDVSDSACGNCNSCLKYRAVLFELGVLGD
jgi:7-cyano-7-deazaguanine synthase